MEIYKLPGKEFKLIVLRKLRELPKNTDNSTISGKQNMKKKKHTKFNKEIEIIKKNKTKPEILKLSNTMNEMRNATARQHQT